MAEKSTKKLGRRDLLKVVTAGAAAVTVSAFLPKKWVKPEVDFGVSPVHAQASIQTGTITGYVLIEIPQKPDEAPNIAGTGMQNAVVSVDGMPALASTTDVNGLYTITNVPVGSRAISCVPPSPYYYPINPNPATNVPVNVVALTPVVQDFLFSNEG